MYIKKARPDNYGKFQKREFTFSPGLNVIYGENESGKSTLVSFLFGMLFGQEKPRGKVAAKVGSDLPAYQKYEPWNAPGFYQGGLEFAVGEKEFSLERSFYYKDKSAKLVCTTDGEELSPEQGDLTMLLGGVSKNFYEHTCYIPQAAVVTEAHFAEELRREMANAAFGGEGDVDLEAAGKILEQHRKEVESLRKAEKQKREEAARRLSWEKDRLFEELAQTEGRKRETEAKKQALEKEWQLFKEEVAQKEVARKLAQAEEKEQAREGAREPGTVLTGKGENSLRERSETGFAFRKNKKALLLLIGIGILLFLWVGLRGQIPGLPALPWNVLDGILWLLWGGSLLFFLYKEGERNREAGDLSEPSEKAAILEGEKLHQQDSLKTETTVAEDATAEEETEEQKDQRKIESLRGEICGQEKAGELLQEQIEEKKTRLMNLEEELLEKAAAGRKEKELEKELEATALAKATLEEVSEALYQADSRNMEEAVSQIFSQLTEGNYSRVKIRENGEVTLSFGEREITPRQLSRGTMEQLYFALRLGLGGYLAKEENLPILLDETFCAYDENRLRRVLRWLSQQPGQVLLFTCQKREMELLKEEGISHHIIKL